jgi:tRNA pseudouridine55 synthase
MKQAPKEKVARRPVHGVLLLDKSLGYSSNQILQKVKWLFRALKAGHTGTLDPLASGVLPICFGAATKFSQLHLNADKCYEAVLRLGVTTSTGDAEGDIVSTRPVVCDAEQVAAAVSSFLGQQWQTPPMTSALKHEGVPLYTLARRGEVIHRNARNITIYSLDLLRCDLTSAEPSIMIRVMCSKGTYIRTLGEDIGAALGCGGHVSYLRRIKTGPFISTQCVTLDDLQAMNECERMGLLLPVNALVSDLLPIVLSGLDVTRFQNGLPRNGSWLDAEQVAVYDADTNLLLGTGCIESGVLSPVRLLSKDETSEMAVRTLEVTENF